MSDIAPEMRLVICYSTRDQVELTKQTLPRLPGARWRLLWADGSRTEAGKTLADELGYYSHRVLGGPDSAIAWKLSKALASPLGFTHIMLLELDGPPLAKTDC